MRHECVEEPLIAAQQALHARSREPANFGRPKRNGGVLVHLGLHAFEPQNVGLSKEPHNPLAPIWKVVSQLHKPRTNGEEGYAFFAGPVYRRARRIMELVDGLVNFIEVPFLQSGEEDRLSNVAVEAIGDACPGLAGCDRVQCARLLSFIPYSTLCVPKLILWRSLRIRNDEKGSSR